MALDEEKTLAIVRGNIDAGASSLEIVGQCRAGVEIVGRNYSEGVLVEII